MMLLLFGPPGVGKGTQADLLSKEYNLTKFSMGDILREEISINSPTGVRIKRFLDQGTLAPDDIVFDIVEDFLIANRNSHLLFDGFPRNLNQALNLEKTLAQLGLSINLALELYLPQEEIIKRTVNRRSCPSCNRLYNYITSPPKKENNCDFCGSELLKRNDDSEEIIKKRLEIYETETRPLIEYYKSLNVYKQLEATGSPEEVLEKVSPLVNAYIR